MFDIFGQMKPALQRWRKLQHDLEDLIEPECIAQFNLIGLQVQAQQLQLQINSLVMQAQLKAQEAQDPRKNQAQIQMRIQFLQNQAQALQMELNALAPQIAQAQAVLAGIEDKMKDLRGEQAKLARENDASVGEWKNLCDILGVWAAQPIKRRFRFWTSGSQRSLVCGSSI